MNIQEIVKSALTLKEANMSEEEIVKSLEETFQKSKEEKEKKDHEEYEKEKRDKEKEKEERAEGREEEKEEEKEKMDSMEKSIENSIIGFKDALEKSFNEQLAEIKEAHRKEIEEIQKSISVLKEERPNFQHVPTANVLEKSMAPNLRKNEETGKVQLSCSKEREAVKSVLMQQFVSTEGEIKKSIEKDIMGYGVNCDASISSTTLKHLSSIGIEITQ